MDAQGFESTRTINPDFKITSNNFKVIMGIVLGLGGGEILPFLYRYFEVKDYVLALLQWISEKGCRQKRVFFTVFQIGIDCFWGAYDLAKNILTKLPDVKHYAA